MKFPLWWTENGACACPAGVECVSPGKHPLTRNGVKDATDDPAQIAEWRARWPLAHWANATGAESGIVAVDLDRKPGRDGVASLAALGTVPRTRTIRTGSGGLHLYFRHPGGRYPNTAGKLGPGIDTRGDGGYVVAPGSGHVSGGAYTLLIDCEPAELPAWLLPTAAPVATPTVRGHFPPASEAVLSAARAALENHGVAVEGSGGDAHTWQAAALLVHDFALTDSEAWPLFSAWNDDCQPPWDETALRSKLEGGGRYGSAPYGCRRTQDVIEQVQRLVEQWRNAGASDNQIPDLVARIREIPVDDPTKHALIERELTTATGLKRKALGLPAHSVEAEVKAGEIQVTPRLHIVADEATVAIAPRVFMRNGVLCEVVKQERTFIADLEPARIVDLMSATASYVRLDEQKGSVQQAPPAPVAAILHSRRTHRGLRVLEAVTTAPVFLADGTILQERGYNEQARVYLEPSVTVDVPDKPTLDDAQAAVALFADLLCDFQFASPADFSSWLAALLSPLVKAATGNAPAPLVCVSASNAGAGKTLLTKSIAQIVTGADAEIRPYNPRDASEWGKRLTSFVKMASPISVFDNVNGPIGDEGLDRLITSSTWSDRQLGATDAPPLPNVTTWLATGNNIEPVGDTVRRALGVRTIVDVERPQERTGFKYDLEGAHCIERRSPLLSAALTILRAYHVAGRPPQALPAWGSFGAWSALVRASLVWAGCADPFLTQQRASRDLNEPEETAHDFWVGVIEASDGTPASVCTVANQRDAMKELGTREAMTPAFLRRFVGRFVDRPRAGKRIRRTGAVYSVEAL